ncbi:MAG TPA: hypothetical protein VJH94_01340 [Candidatus Paceibacterota bacterium]
MRIDHTVETLITHQVRQGEIADMIARLGIEVLPRAGQCQAATFPPEGCSCSAPQGMEVIGRIPSPKEQPLAPGDIHRHLVATVAAETLRRAIACRICTHYGRVEAEDSPFTLVLFGRKPGLPTPPLDCLEG